MPASARRAVRALPGAAGAGWAVGPHGAGRWPGLEQRSAGAAWGCPRVVLQLSRPAGEGPAAAGSLEPPTALPWGHWECLRGVGGVARVVVTGRSGLLAVGNW